MLRLRGGSAPVALSRARRSLTLSSTQPNNAQTASHQHPQEQSSFFRLPPELRQIIYREALIPHAPIHVRRTHRRLCSTPCEGAPHRQKCVRLMASDGTVARRLPSEARRRDKILPLLCTCRGIYSEAVDLISTTNTFLFEDVATLAALPQCITPNCLSSIRRVRLDLDPFNHDISLPNLKAGWQPAVDALAAMHGLVELTIRLPWSDELAPWRLHRASLLDPLKKLTTPKRFTLEVPPSVDLESNVDGVDEDVPYTLVAKAELQLRGQKPCNWWGGDGRPFPFMPPF
ncbi:hypothetical protein BJY01DRAFT_249988 [Aspergillus pseudoustus]|uniref:DUF7730 domain-containing protein n=1 Tax=Aspergillus pseudoustus TaxID=1810923 RepID=A0ABR4JKJ4_9EURO